MDSAMEAQGNFVVCDGDVGRHINARLARRLPVGPPRYRPRKIGRCEVAIGTTTRCQRGCEASSGRQCRLPTAPLPPQHRANHQKHVERRFETHGAPQICEPR